MGICSRGDVEAEDRDGDVVLRTGMETSWKRRAVVVEEVWKTN